jgi:hypothetical protein
MKRDRQCQKGEGMTHSKIRLGNTKLHHVPNRPTPISALRNYEQVYKRSQVPSKTSADKEKWCQKKKKKKHDLTRG